MREFSKPVAGVISRAQVGVIEKSRNARAWMFNSPPVFLPGLVLWLDAPNVIQNSSSVTAWRDLSGYDNSLNVVSGVPVFSATGGSNSTSMVTFNGTSFLKRTTSIVTGADAARTMFCVSKAADLTTAGMVTIDGSNDAGQGFGYLLNWDPTKRTVYMPGVTGEEDTTSTLTTAWERVCLVNNNNGGLAGNQQLYVNGTLHAIGGGAHAPLAATGGFFVGSSGNATFLATCSISEIILYNRVLSDNERSMIDSYLSAKYSL